MTFSLAFLKGFLAGVTWMHRSQKGDGLQLQITLHCDEIHVHGDYVNNQNVERQYTKDH